MHLNVVRTAPTIGAAAVPLSRVPGLFDGVASVMWYDYGEVPQILAYCFIANPPTSLYFYYATLIGHFFYSFFGSYC
jgi:MFS superfamily sulfate permease-like transporter